MPAKLNGCLVWPRRGKRRKSARISATAAMPAATGKSGSKPYRCTMAEAERRSGRHGETPGHPDQAHALAESRLGRQVGRERAAGDGEQAEPQAVQRSQHQQQRHGRDPAVGDRGQQERGQPQQQEESASVRVQSPAREGADQYGGPGEETYHQAGRGGPAPEREHVERQRGGEHLERRVQQHVDDQQEGEVAAPESRARVARGGADRRDRGRGLGGCVPPRAVPLLRVAHPSPPSSW